MRLAWHISANLVAESPQRACSKLDATMCVLVLFPLLHALLILSLASVSLQSVGII